jgi:GDP/UDP-N,N'-diacetylbacillosamine 2-epimerase (hydrolysing)
MKRKICVVTGSRAEYGLLRWVMEGIKNHPALTLQVAVTGMHLSAKYGHTFREIEQDGFHIDERIPVLTDEDTPLAISQAIGEGVSGFARAFDLLQPDLVLVLGDRYEIFSAATAALIACIPLAHIHGGEITEGAIDDSIRHSITKMSHLHFVANDAYRRRVLQLGESASHVFNVGGLGVDCISRNKFIPKIDLEKDLNFQFKNKNLMITYHPVTLEANKVTAQFSELLKALDHFPDIGLIFTHPNADAGNFAISSLINDFVVSHQNAKAFASLGSTRYLSCLSYVDGIIGNSSSGLLEAPTLKIGTVNIGNRQKGRLMSTSVISCSPAEQEIVSAIQKLLSDDFQRQLPLSVNPYGEPGASDQIVHLLHDAELVSIISKKFTDLN